MRIHRRTAVWLCAFAVALSVAVTGWYVTRPAYLGNQLQKYLQGILGEGLEIRLGPVDYDIGKGLVRVEGSTLLRTGPHPEVVARVPSLEVETRLWELVVNHRVTEVRVRDPELLLEYANEGITGFESLLSTGGGEVAVPRPHILIQGGLVRFRAPEFLAEGEEVRLAVESLELDESRSGGPSPIRGTLVELGSAAHGGSGALGRVTIDGEFPFSPLGFHVRVEKFECDEFLRERLARPIREKQLDLVSLDGTFGEGPAGAGFQVDIARAPDAKKPSVGFTLRPRGVNFLFKDLPVLFTGVTGDANWKDGAIRLDHFTLFYNSGEIRVNGSADRIADTAKCDLQFWARNLYLDRGLRSALPPSIQRVWDAYDFSGVVDLTAAPQDESEGSYDCSIRREKEGGPLEVHITAQVIDGELSYRGYLDHQGKRQGFDYPLTGILGKVMVRSPADSEGAYEIFLDDLRGRHGTTEVRASGSVKEWPTGRTAVDIGIEARDLPLDRDIRAAAPSMEDIFQRYSPKGRASLIVVHVEQVPDADRSATYSVTIGMDGKAGFTYGEFPVPLEEVSGTVKYAHPLEGGRRETVIEISGLKGTTPGGATIAVDGSIDGEKDARLNLKVRAETLLLDGDLESAIRERKKELRTAVAIWDQLRPSGPADAIVDVEGTVSRQKMTYHVILRGACAKGWGDLDFPIAGLFGTVDVTPPEDAAPGEIRLRGLTGLHAGRDVSVDGVVVNPEGKASIDLTVKAAGVPLDESARGILGHVAEKLGGYFATVKPAAGFQGDATVHLTGPADALDAAVLLENLNGGLAPFDLRDFRLDGGSAGYDRGIVTLRGLVGAVGPQGDRRLTIDRGRLDLERGEGDLHLELRRLRLLDLKGLISEDMAASIEKAVPGRFIHMDGLDVSLGQHWRRLELSGLVSLSPQKEDTGEGLGLEGDCRLDRMTFLRGPGEGDPTEVSGGVDLSLRSLTAGVKIEQLDGHLALGGSFGEGGRGVSATLSGAAGRVEGRELKDAGGELLLKGGDFLLTDFRGTLARGQLGASVEVGGERNAFEVHVTLSNAGARALFTPADSASKLVGNVTAKLVMGRKWGPKQENWGSGRVEITDAELFQAPVLLSIGGLLGFKKPPEFTSGKVVFQLFGDKLIFDELDLDSSVIALHKAVGQSSARLDGRLSLKVLPEFKSLTSDSWLIFKIPLGIINPALKLIGERLYTIQVTGTIQHPEVSQKVLPGLFTKDDQGRPLPILPPAAFTVDRRPAWDF
jgi:hypothetical protein